MNTVWIYVDITKGVGDLNHLRVFATADAANKWLDENDPEGMAFDIRLRGRLRLRRSVAGALFHPGEQGPGAPATHPRPRTAL